MKLRRFLAMTAAVALPAAAWAQAEEEAPPPADEKVVVAQFTDEEVHGLLEKLQSDLKAEAEPVEGEEPARRRRGGPLDSYTSSGIISRGLKSNKALADSQVKTLVMGLERLKEAYPNKGAKFDMAIFKTANLSIGREAPNIEGVDTDEVGFELKDYRGKVVVLDFWGDW